MNRKSVLLHNLLSLWQPLTLFVRVCVFRMYISQIFTYITCVCVCVNVFATHQYCHILRAWYGKLHSAKVNTKMMSMRTTPRLARNTLFDECDMWATRARWCGCGCADVWWWCCIKLLLCVLFMLPPLMPPLLPLPLVLLPLRHADTMGRSESSETYNWMWWDLVFHLF